MLFGSHKKILLATSSWSQVQVLEVKVRVQVHKIGTSKYN